MKLNVELARRSDGVWTAQVLEMPGVRALGEDRLDAFRRVQARALRLMASRLEHGEPLPGQNAELTLAFSLL